MGKNRIQTKEKQKNKRGRGKNEIYNTKHIRIQQQKIILSKNKSKDKFKKHFNYVSNT